jgi:hypothetical protein
MNDWFESKPSFMQKALKQAALSADVKEVASFFDQYKLEIGLNKQPQEPPKVQVQTLSPQAQAKLQSAIAVPSRRVSPAPAAKGRVDPNDLDQAWADWQAVNRK